MDPDKKNTPLEPKDTVNINQFPEVFFFQNPGLQPRLSWQNTGYPGL